MARKEKYTLDYYPHYAIQGDIVNVIQELYGNDGYAVLHKNYEQFCLRDNQYIDLSNYSTLAVIAAYCKVTKERYLEIVEELVKLDAYDKDFWEQKKILISEKFMENTKEAYSRRKNEAPNFERLKNKLQQKSTSKSISVDINSENLTSNGISDCRNTQRIGKDIKGKERKKEEEEEKKIFSKNNSENIPLNEMDTEAYKRESENWRGTYNNVHLTDEQYRKLQTMILSKEKTDEIINDFSENIASNQGKAKPYDEDFPEMHFITCKKYWEYRKQNPEKFSKDNKKKNNSNRRGVSQEFIDNFFANLKNEEIKNNEQR